MLARILQNLRIGHTRFKRCVEYLLGKDTRGIMLYLVGTPTKLRFDDQASDAEIVGVIVKAVDISGETRQISPTVERHDILSAEGVIGAICWKSITEKYIIPIAIGNSWKFMHIAADSDSANYKMISAIAEDFAEFRRPLSSFTP